MTNQLPNDLSHLSEEEFNSLCPQGEHAPGPQPLSPAAQAVLDAFSERYELCGPFDGNWQELCLAAAIRAAADIVDEFIAVRDLHTIAAELEGTK